MSPEDRLVLRELIAEVVTETLAALPKRSRAGFLTFEEASELLCGTPIATIRRWVWEGRIKTYKPGKHPLIKESELLAFIESNESRRKKVARRKAKAAAGTALNLADHSRTREC